MQSTYITSVVRDIQLLAGREPGDESIRASARDVIQRLIDPVNPVEDALLRQLVLKIVVRMGDSRNRLMIPPDCDSRSFIQWLLAPQWRDFALGALSSLSIDNPTVPSGAMELVRRAAQSVRFQVRGNLNVDVLAKQSFCHRRTLERAFRQVMGSSVHEFIVRERTLEAIRLIKSTDLKLEAVAFEVGFRSRTTLRRAIKATTGLTPAQLRERSRTLP
jgi:AraC-like DNA-binding protein